MMMVGRQETVINRRSLDEGWSWIVLVGSFVSSALVGGIYFAYGVFTQAWINEYDSSAAITSMVGSTASAFTSMGAPLASYILNRWDCRTCHFAGGLMVTTGVFLSSFASSLEYIFLFYGVLGGLGLGLCYVPAIIVISEYFKKKRPLAIGIASSGIGIGSFIFPLVLDVLQESYSWRGSILILSAFMGNACVCAAVMFPEPKPPSKCTDNPVGFCDHNQNTKISSLRHVNTRLHNQFESRFEEDNLSDARTEANAITKMDGRDSQRRNSFAVIRNFVLHPWIRRKSSVADDDVCEECKLDQIDFKLEEFEKLETLHESSELAIFSSPHDEQTADVEKEPVVGSIKSLKKSFSSQSAEVLCNPYFYVMAFSNLTMFIGMMIVYGLTPIRATSDFKFTKEQGALFVATIGLANLFGRFAWGALSNLCSFVSPVTLFICLRLAASVLTFFSPLASSFGLHMTFCVTAGLTFGCWSLYPLMVAKLFGERCNGTAFGFLEFFDGIGSILGPTLGGLIFDISGSYSKSFVLSGASLAIGALFLFVMEYFRKYRRRMSHK